MHTRDNQCRDNSHRRTKSTSGTSFMIRQTPLSSCVKHRVGRRPPLRGLWIAAIRHSQSYLAKVFALVLRRKSSKVHSAIHRAARPSVDAITNRAKCQVESLSSLYELFSIREVDLATFTNYLYSHFQNYKDLQHETLFTIKKMLCIPNPW